MRRVLLASLAGVGLLVVHLHAQTTPIFRMNCTAANVPDCNWGSGAWDTTHEGVYYNRTIHTDGSGPGGANYLQVDWIPTMSLCSACGWGWLMTTTVYSGLEPGGVAQGSARYVRFRARVRTPYNWVSNGNPGNKVIDFGVLCENPTYQPTRTVNQWYGHDVVGTWDMDLYQGGGGGPTVERDDITLDTWHDFQFKYQSGSTDAATDGAIYIYMDSANNSESTPSDSELNFRWRTTGWPGGSCVDGQWGIGTTMDSIAIGASVGYDICCIEYDDAFDTTWGGGSGSSSAPIGARMWRFLRIN